MDTVKSDSSELLPGMGLRGLWTKRHRRTQNPGRRGLEPTGCTTVGLLVVLTLTSRVVLLGLRRPSLALVVLRPPTVREGLPRVPVPGVRL